MMKKMHSRGQADMVPWMVRLGVMLIAVIVIVMLVRTYTNREADSPELMRSAYLYRLYYGDVIMHSDNSIGRIYPGIVDANKFTSQNLDATFSERPFMRDFGKISSRLSMRMNSDCPFSLAEPVIYNDKQTYDRYSPFTGVAMGSGATEENVTFPVNVRQGLYECAAQLEIHIVRPNS